MFTGMNKIFEKHQKILLTIIGIVVVVPFVGFVPGADLFDFFKKTEIQQYTVNDDELSREEIEKQHFAYRVGRYLNVTQGYAKNLEGKNLTSLIALHRYALIKQLKEKNDFNAITKEELTKFLKESLKSIKDAKNFISTIQQNFNKTPKEMENIIVENYFIKKNNKELKKQVVIDQKAIKNAYIKENTLYTIKALKFSSDDGKFFDQTAKEYYNKQKTSFTLPESFKVSYINFDKNSIKADEISNLNSLAEKRWDKSKSKYINQSNQKKIGLIGLTIENFSNTKKYQQKNKTLQKLKLKLKKEGFNKLIKNENQFDYQTTFWEGEFNNAFTNTVMSLKKGQISKKITLQKHEFFPQGIYFIQVIDQRSGTFTDKVKNIIKNEILREKNENNNKNLAKITHKLIEREKSFSDKTARFEKQAKKLNLHISESPYITKTTNPSKTHSKEFINVTLKLSQEKPLSNIFKNNKFYSIALFIKKGDKYKSFNQVKSFIKEKLYKEKAKTYYDNNKELFKVEQTKYGYAVNFYPNVKSVTIKDSEALKYYKKNEKTYQQKQAQVRLISLNFKKGEKAKTKAKLKAIIDTIKNKKITFENAAIKYSDDEKSNTKKEKGLIGWITENRHSASKTIFETKNEQISAIYQGDKKLQIFKIEQISKNIPYPRAKESIINLLKRQKAITNANNKKEKFYNQIEAIWTKEKKNFSQAFKNHARKNGFSPIPISTKNNYRYIQNLVKDLKIRNADNPLIINEQDFWVACYDRTEEEKLLEFSDKSTMLKAINVVNKEESLNLVNKNFNTIFSTLNKSTTEKQKNQLMKKYAFTTEEPMEYKSLPKYYKGLINDKIKNNQILTSKNFSNEQIIFTIVKKKVPTNEEYNENLETFTKEYTAKEEEGIIDKFYQEFIKKNTINF